MTQQIVKNKLSGSTDGKGILVQTTSTTIHTSIAGTTAGDFDEIWIFACNRNTSNENLIIEWGATDGTQDIKLALTPNSGGWVVIPGDVLRNGMVVTAKADTNDKVLITGYVNEIRH